MKNNQHSDNLVTGPIPGLVWSIAVPAVVGFLFHTLFNVTDMWFAGQISTQGQAALGLAFPVFFIVISIGNGLATGATALVGTALGESAPDKARTNAVQAVLFAVLAGVLLVGAGPAVSPTLFGLMGADGQYLSTVNEYMGVIFMGAPILCLGFMLNGLLNSMGDTRSNRNYLVTAFLANIGLDPWFIHGGFGIPAMGFKGIALATVLVNAGGVLYLSYKVWRSGLMDGLKWSDIRPRLLVLADVARQGLPASLNIATIGMGIFVITYFFAKFGQNAVAAYGIATRVEQLVLMPSIGLNIAVLSLVAQNRGAGRMDRVRETFVTALKYGAWIMLPGTVVVMAAAPFLMSLFSDDSEVVAHGARYLQIESIAFYGYVILFVSVATLQGLKKPMFAIWIGLFRQIAAPVATFWFTTQVMGWGLDSIYIGITGIVCLSACIALFYARRALAREQARCAPGGSSPCEPGCRCCQCAGDAMGD